MTVTAVAGLTVEELEERLPPSALDAAEILHDLEATGLVERDDEGRWTLTRSGWKIARGLLDAGPADIVDEGQRRAGERRA